jgi:hypothetical protein
MGGFALAVVVIAILAVVASMLYYNYRRGQALMAFAASQGWTYVDEVPELEARWDGDPFGKGDRRQTDNAIRGSYQGFDLAAFEYSYETHTTDSKGQRSTTTHRYSVVALLTGSPLPGLSVSPEGGISRMFGRLFNTDIQLESEEFNRAFTVECADRKFAYDVLHPRLMEYLLTVRHVAWKTTNGYILTIESGKHSAEEIEPRVQVLDTILDMIPEFVRMQYGMPGSQELR